MVETTNCRWWTGALEDEEGWARGAHSYVQVWCIWCVPGEEVLVACVGVCLGSLVLLTLTPVFLVCFMLVLPSERVGGGGKICAVRYNNSPSWMLPSGRITECSPESMPLKRILPGLQCVFVFQVSKKICADVSRIYTKIGDLGARNFRLNNAKTS